MYEVGVVDRRSDAGSESTSPMPFEVDKLLCHPDRTSSHESCEISSSPSSLDASRTLPFGGETSLHREYRDCMGDTDRAVL